MPENAIRDVNVQYIVRLAEMAPLLTKLTTSDQDKPPTRPSAAPLIESGGRACPEGGGSMHYVQNGQPGRVSLPHRAPNWTSDDDRPEKRYRGTSDRRRLVAVRGTHRSVQ